MEQFEKIGDKILIDEAQMNVMLHNRYQSGVEDGREIEKHNHSMLEKVSNKCKADREEIRDLFTNAKNRPGRKRGKRGNNGDRETKE